MKAAQSHLHARFAVWHRPLLTLGMFMVSSALSCPKDELPTAPNVGEQLLPPASIYDLSLKDIEVLVARDFMPVVMPPGVPAPSDRIYSRVKMTMENTSTAGRLDTVLIVSTVLTRVRDGEVLARFQYIPDTVTNLRPQSSAVRTYYRIPQAADSTLVRLGSSVCGDTVQLSFFVLASGTKAMAVTANPVVFQCTY